jgi:uncharacterized pyridoxal phosphate-containing UPF0001 family protein
MPTTVRLESQVSTDDLLHAVDHLPDSELQDFLERAWRLKAARVAKHLTSNETVLLEKITNAIPNEVQQRFDVLIAKRNKNTLSQVELQELLSLTDQIENLDAARVEALMALATLRNTDLDNLMLELGVSAQDA